MRIFSSFTDALNETLRELFSRGRVVFDPTLQGKTVDRKDYEQKELIGYAFTVVIRDLEKDLKEMLDFARGALEKDWFNKETADRWVEQILNFKWPEDWYKGTGLEEYWKKFGLEKDKSFSYQYNERLSTVIPRVIYALKQNKYMRGAVATVYESARDITNMGKGRRVPCTQYMQWLIRNEGGEDVMTSIVTFRSQDLATFFPLDVYKTAMISKYIADQLGVEYKYYIHFAGSLHSYKCMIPKRYQW